MSGLRQIPNDGRFFVPISSLAYTGSINELNRTNGTLQTAAWLRAGYTSGGFPGGPGGGSSYLSSVNGPGAGKMRDLGKTYVSAGRTFRKVQLISMVDRQMVPQVHSVLVVRGAQYPILTS